MTGPADPGRRDRPRTPHERTHRKPRGRAYYEAERARKVPLGCLVVAIGACAVALLVLLALAFVDFEHRIDAPEPAPDADTDTGPTDTAPAETGPEG
jgi:hypothetical protein